MIKFIEIKREKSYHKVNNLDVCAKEQSLQKHDVGYKKRKSYTFRFT